MSPPRRRMTMSEAWDRAVRARGGRRAPKTSTSYQATRDVVKAYGEQGALDQLGVTRRTLRSWLNPDPAKRRTPSKASEAVIRAAQQTPAVRRLAVGARRANRFATQGMHVKFTGHGGPKSDIKYQRDRGMEFKIPPEAAEQVLDAFVEGGPEAAQSALEQAMTEHYVPSVEMTMNEASRFDFDFGSPGDD